MQQWSMRYAESTEVACLAAERAAEFAWWATPVALVAVLAARRWRDRAAAEGQHGLWAVAMLLLGAMHVLMAMFLAPSGCMSGQLFGRLLSAASPWVVAAGLFRTGVPPTSGPLSPPDPGESRR